MSAKMTVMDILGREEDNKAICPNAISATLHAENLWYMDVSPTKASDRATYRRRHSPEAKTRDQRRRGVVTVV
jgi:hypothetical protein